MIQYLPFGKGDKTIRWVPTGWLNEHLDDPHLRIIDCQPNNHDYFQSHIPRALYLNEQVFRIHEGTIPTRWISPIAAGELIRTLGLSVDSAVLIYTSGGPMVSCGCFIGDGLEQTMVAYSLIRYGLKDVLILDGGLDKWREENRPLTQEFGVCAPSFFSPTLMNEWIVSMEDLKKMKEDSDVLLLDARPPMYYEGKGPWIRPGHIPGAINLPWKGLMTDTNKKLLKTEDEIQRIVREAGADPEKTIICSCGTGRAATNEFLIFKWLLGYKKVLIYEGGFTEWSSYPENEVVTGKET